MHPIFVDALDRCELLGVTSDTGYLKKRRGCWTYGDRRHPTSQVIDRCRVGQVYASSIKNTLLTRARAVGLSPRGRSQPTGKLKGLSKMTQKVQGQQGGETFFIHSPRPRAQSKRTHSIENSYLLTPAGLYRTHSKPNSRRALSSSAWRRIPPPPPPVPPPLRSVPSSMTNLSKVARKSTPSPSRNARRRPRRRDTADAALRAAACSEAKTTREA